MYTNYKIYVNIINEVFKHKEGIEACKPVTVRKNIEGGGLDNFPNSFSAFTLAEVLITLGIIGVVAAFTLPTLINNYRKTVAVNQLKYAYSTLSQVFTMAQKDYGQMSEWDIESNFVFDMDSDAQEVNDSLRNFAHKYMKPYLKVMIDCDTGSSKKSQCDYPIYLEKGVLANTQQGKTNDYRFITNNGMIIHLLYDNNKVNYGNGIFLWVDINGKQKPNTYGEDLFCMYLKNSRNKFYMYGIGETRENLLNGHVRGCTHPTSWIQGQWCGALIQHDGWQIKDDYPRFK